MKRTFLKFCSLALALVMTLATFAGTFTFTASAETPTPWDGTTKDTDWASAGTNAYYITSAAELAGLAANTKTNTYSGYTFYITENLDLGDKEWTPVGPANGTPFAGSLIGALGHATNVDVQPTDELQPVTITGFSMKNNGTKNQGLVGTLTGPAIKNIIMVEPEINSAVNTTGFIVGYTKTYSNVVLENLAVIDGVMNWSGTGTYAGGIASYTNNLNVTFENCYFSGVINSTGGGKRVGGIVGCVEQKGTYRFINCQMDGIVNGGATQIGAFIGRVQTPLTSAGTTTVELENCVITGVATQTYSAAKAFSWIGTFATPGNADDKHGVGVLTYNNCYSNATIPFVANNDHYDAAKLNLTVNANGVVGTSVESTSANAYDSYRAYSVSNATVGTSLPGALWQQATGETPVLKIGATATREYATADLSWFNPLNYKDGFTITTDAQYLGLAQLSQLPKYYKTEYTYAIAKTVDTASYASKFADGFLTAIEPLVANKFADEGDLTLKLQVPAGATLEDEETKLRLVSALDAADLEKYVEVGFVLFVNGSTVAKLDTTTVFETINGTANGMAVEYDATAFGKTADDYLFTQVIEGIPTGEFTTKLDIRVYAIEADGTVVYGQTYYDVTVKAQIEALTPAE